MVPRTRDLCIAARYPSQRGRRGVTGDADAQRVVCRLIAPGGVLHSVVAGAHAPVVTLTSPNGGEILDGDPLPVSWVAADEDGDPLTFNVQYSADDGVTWELVARDVRESRVDIERVNLIGSLQGRVRVLATDGVHTGWDDSDAAFTLTARTPTVEITEPANHRTLAVGQTVTFTARAVDPDRGSLPPDAITWTSDQDGVLGQGAVLPVASLSVGTHRVTVRAEDTTGAAATDAVSVTVVGTLAELPAPADALTVKPVALHLDPAIGLWEDVFFIDNANLAHSLAWVASVDVPWLQMTAGSGISPGPLWVGVDAASLADGEYAGVVTVSSPDLPESEQRVPVSVTIRRHAFCAVDCNRDNAVTVDELIQAVGISVGSNPLTACGPADTNLDGTVMVDELIQGVNAALSGCPADGG
jgi:hypothetical protein